MFNQMKRWNTKLVTIETGTEVFLLAGSYTKSQPNKAGDPPLLLLTKKNYHVSPTLAKVIQVIGNFIRIEMLQDSKVIDG